MEKLKMGYFLLCMITMINAGVAVLNIIIPIVTLCYRYRGCLPERTNQAEIGDTVLITISKPDKKSSIWPHNPMGHICN